MQVVIVRFQFVSSSDTLNISKAEDASVFSLVSVAHTDRAADWIIWTTGVTGMLGPHSLGHNEAGSRLLDSLFTSG